MNREVRLYQNRGQDVNTSWATTKGPPCHPYMYILYVQYLAKEERRTLAISGQAQNAPLPSHPCIQCSMSSWAATEGLLGTIYKVGTVEEHQS